MFKEKKFRMMVIGTYLFVALATYFVGLRMESLNNSHDTISQNKLIAFNIK